MPGEADAQSTVQVESGEKTNSMMFNRRTSDERGIQGPTAEADGQIDDMAGADEEAVQI